MAETTAGKGWVRDGILSCLARGPTTGSEIAHRLGVSKATVTYHTKALLRRNIIEISDVKGVRGGVYSKTFALRPGSLVLARRRAEQEDSRGKLDEEFERLLMSWHLGPSRPPSDEVKMFLYHAYRLLSESDSLDGAVFEEFGSRAGEQLISGSLRFETIGRGIKELAYYLTSKGMAEARADVGKGEAQIVCAGCFENREHGGLVCSFTKGIIEGTLRAKRGGRHTVEMTQRTDPSECVFKMTWGRSAG